MPMQRNGNRTKTVYGTSVRRSEYEDAILRTNMRTENKHQSDLHYYDRAQKVVMNDLRKQSFILQNKLSDANNKKPSIGSSRLGSSRLGSSASPQRRYSSPSSTGKLFNNNNRKVSLTTPTVRRSSFLRSPTKMAMDRENEVSESPSPGASMTFSRQDALFKSPTTPHVASRGQADGYLASILNDTMADQFEYSHGVHMTPTYKLQAARPLRDDGESGKNSRKVSLTNVQNGRLGD